MPLVSFGLPASPGRVFGLARFRLLPGRVFELVRFRLRRGGFLGWIASGFAGARLGWFARGLPSTPIQPKALDAMRSVTETGVMKYAEGSAHIECGDTIVVVSASAGGARCRRIARTPDSAGVTAARNPTPAISARSTATVVRANLRDPATHRPGIACRHRHESPGRSLRVDRLRRCFGLCRVALGLACLRGFAGPLPGSRRGPAARLDCGLFRPSGSALQTQKGRRSLRILRPAY
jgi:hypothetical protein